VLISRLLFPTVEGRVCMTIKSSQRRPAEFCRLYLLLPTTAGAQAPVSTTRSKHLCLLKQIFCRLCCDSARFSQFRKLHPGHHNKPVLNRSNRLVVFGANGNTCVVLLSSISPAQHTMHSDLVNKSDVNGDRGPRAMQRRYT